MPILDYAILGKTIRRYRKAHQMTQFDLADTAGISLSFLGHIERGTRKASIETLIAVALTLGVTPDELLGDAINPDITPPSAPRAQYHLDAIRQELDKLQGLLK